MIVPFGTATGATVRCVPPPRYITCWLLPNPTSLYKYSLHCNKLLHNNHPFSLDNEQKEKGEREILHTTLTYAYMASKSVVAVLLVLLVFVAGLNFGTCKPTKRLGKCSPSGYLRGKSGNCNKEHDSDCCVDGKMYPQYRCSPPITGNTGATMTINSFAKGGDGGGPSECDNQCHSDDELVLARLVDRLVQWQKPVPEQHQNQCQW